MADPVNPATRFHVNPKTGKTGPCGANPNLINNHGCPFGMEFHGSSLEEVETAYEKMIAEDDDPATNAFGTLKKSGPITDEGYPKAAVKAKAEETVKDFIDSDAGKWTQVSGMNKGTRGALLKAAANPYLAEQLKVEGRTFNSWAKQAFTQWTTQQGALGPMAGSVGYSQTGTNGWGITEPEIKRRLADGQLAAESQVALRGGKISPKVKATEKELRGRLDGFPEELNFKENSALVDDSTVEGEKYRTAESMVNLNEDFKARVKAHEAAGSKTPVLAAQDEYRKAWRSDDDSAKEIMDLNHGQALRVYLRAIEPDPDSDLYADVWNQLADKDQPPVGQQNIAEKLGSTVDGSIGEKISSIFRRK